ncbi:UNVERIFIED_CONTAM: Retrovirus-related Pol polyprotein from transposon RE2 [Sesamum radiatum]|uniref:Retrovirus-related Pol polyprotein from transposon RE2 n=1 Tax=Sesamum radiatum TaxID=300843 RepID=A0AAW2TGA4_SESRA
MACDPSTLRPKKWPYDLSITKRNFLDVANDLSLIEYLTKVTKLWNELSVLAPAPKCKCGGCTCGINEAIDSLTSSTQVMQFLMGLHDGFSNERSQILMLDPLPDIERTFSMVYAVEKQRDVHTDLENNSNHNAFQLAVGSDKSSSQNVAEIVAEVLNRMQKSDVPSDPLSHYANFTQFDDDFAGNTVTPTEIDKSCWILDTGATNHVCANIDLFQSYAKLTQPQYIHLPDGSKRMVQYTGMVKLNDKIWLENVLFVPQFSVNLLLVSQMCRQGNCQLLFTQRDCVLQDQNVTCSTSVPCSSSKWHNRLGHASAQAIKHILNIDCDEFNADTPCDVCHRAKQNRLPFSISHSHSTEIFDLVHMDLWGPYRANFISGCAYVFTLVDDCSRSVWTFLLKQKNQVSSILKKFCSLVRNQFNKGIKVIRSDNALEFINQECRMICETLGIVHQTSCTYTPQQNGRVERKHRHLLNVARALLFQDVQSGHSTTEFVSSSPPLPTVPLHLDTMLTHPVQPTATIAVNDSPNTSRVVSPQICDNTVHDVVPLRRYQRSREHVEWQDAMKAELDALERNCTWKLTPLPAGKRPIGCKWIFKTKLRADGTVERYKARLVAKGFNQIAGVDYSDNFSPVAKTVTVRLFLSLAAIHGWPLHQMDINNAFLHGHLDEDLYMSPPDRYAVQPGFVCKLERSIYDLKQASHQWNAELTLKLTEFGFKQSAHDHCLFTQSTSDGFLALLVYVDDILVTAPTVTLIQQVKDYLHNLFTIKDLGTARYFLGLEIARNSDGIYVAQHKYIQDIIRDIGLMNAKTTSTPFPLGLKLTENCGGLLDDPENKDLVGRLLYLGYTRPDISHSVQQLSQFLQRPCDVHWRAAVHVVRYLKGTATKGLFLPSDSSCELRAYCDADWASCSDSRRSLTGFCVFFRNALISWKTKKQSTVSRSTAEAEYRSMAATVCELRWISYLLSNLGVSIRLPIQLFCDNQAAMHIMANPVFHERTKHIELDCHIVRDAYKDGFISPSFVRSSSQIADIFTKVLGLKSFVSLLGKLGLAALQPSPTCGGDVELLHPDEAAMDSELQTAEGVGDAIDVLDAG